MIDDELQRVWLESQFGELAIPWFIGPRIPEFGAADILGVLTAAPGAGLTNEGINEVASFQLRWIGRERDYQQLKRAVWAYHRTLLQADPSALPWGCQVIWVSPAGGGPSAENPDGRDLDRVMFTCTYLAETEL